MWLFLIIVNNNWEKIQKNIDMLSVGLLFTRVAIKHSVSTLGQANQLDLTISIKQPEYSSPESKFMVCRHRH
jgi:hypothetical protein